MDLKKQDLWEVAPSEIDISYHRDFSEIGNSIVLWLCLSSVCAFLNGVCPNHSSLSRQAALRCTCHTVISGTDKSSDWTFFESVKTRLENDSWWVFSRSGAAASTSVPQTKIKRWYIQDWWLFLINIVCNRSADMCPLTSRPCAICQKDPNVAGCTVDLYTPSFVE